MFRKYQATAEVFRAGYVTEGAYKKSGYVTTGKTYIGHLKGQSIDKVNDLAMFGKVFKFTTEKAADIREADRLKISGADYDVKGATEFEGITFDTKQILVYKV